MRESEYEKLEAKNGCTMLLEIEAQLKNEDDITPLLNLWTKINEFRKEAAKIEDNVKVKIKTYLKERKWNKYNDADTKISVNITAHERENIDKLQLKALLSDRDYATVVTMKSYERLSILTPEAKVRLKKYVK
jgi:Tfp pilus assembly major pilin PilA